MVNIILIVGCLLAAVKILIDRKKVEQFEKVLRDNIDLQHNLDRALKSNTKLTIMLGEQESLLKEGHERAISILCEQHITEREKLIKEIEERDSELEQLLSEIPEASAIMNNTAINSDVTEWILA